MAELRKQFEDHDLSFADGLNVIVSKLGRSLLVRYHDYSKNGTVQSTCIYIYITFIMGGGRYYYHAFRCL